MFEKVIHSYTNSIKICPQEELPAENQKAAL